MILKKSIWLTIIFPLILVGDILYGLFEYYNFSTAISPGILLRGLLFFLSLLVILKHRNLVDKQLFFWILLLVLFSFPSIIVGSLIENIRFIDDILYLLRVFFTPIIILALLTLIRRYDISREEIFKYIEYTAYIISISLIISQFLGAQRLTYGSYAFGNTGIFYAQNDLALALGLALFSAIYRLFIKFSWIKIILIFSSVSAGLQIGTRSSLAITFAYGLLVIGLVFWGRKSTNSAISKNLLNQPAVRFILCILFSGAILLFLYKGIEKHSQHSFQQEKLEHLAQGDLFRSHLLDAGIQHLQNRNSFYHITGEGCSSYGNGVARYYLGRKSYKHVEMDWIDLFGSFGLAFVITLHILFIFVLFGSGKRFILGDRAPWTGLVACSLLIYLGHSVFAGHALTSPLPSTILAGYVCVYLQSRKSRNLSGDALSPIS